MSRVWNQMAFATVGGLGGLSGHHPLTGQTDTSLTWLSVPGGRGSGVPFPEVCRSPTGFPDTVDFISSVRGHVYGCPERERFGICVSRENSTEVGGPEQLGQSHEL